MHLSWGHPVGRIPGTYEGRARDFLTFVTKFLVPVGLFDYFALLGVDPCGNTSAIRCIYFCYDLILFVFTFLDSNTIKVLLLPLLDYKHVIQLQNKKSIGENIH